MLHSWKFMAQMIVRKALRNPAVRRKDRGKEGSLTLWFPNLPAPRTPLHLTSVTILWN